jgi:flavin reductase (DIM6/NTAB) family NADH-FMN oxidoreductase RutF
MSSRVLSSGVLSCSVISSGVIETPKATDTGSDGLRRLFRRHAAAIAVITGTDQGTPVGLLATSLASVSTEPPLLSFNVSRGSSSWPALSTAEHIGVHILHADQEELARRFARSGADRFGAPTVWEFGPYRVPLLDGCAAASVAVVQQRVSAGDHVIIVARLLQVTTDDEVAPLLHYDGGFRRTA